MRYDAELKVRSLDEKLDPATTALVIVDMQNDFAVPAGACEQSGDDLASIEPMVERLRSLLDVARRKQILTVHVRMNNDRPYVAANLAEAFVRRGLGYGPCQSGTEGEKFVDGLEPQPSEHECVVTKHRFSGFWGTEIDLILRSNGITTLVLAGIATEVCVESTARDAFFRDYCIVVAGDCTASFSHARQRASHELFDRSFGLVESSESVAGAWLRSNETRRGWQNGVKETRVLDTLERRVAPAHTAIIMMGFQKSVASSTPSSDGESAEIRMARHLLDRARAAGVMVVHVESNWSEMTRHPKMPAVPTNDVDDDFLEGFEPLAGEPIVRKHRLDAFQDTDLELLLRANDIRSAIFVGLPLERCVDMSARSAAMRDFYVVVPADGVVSGSPDTTQRTAILDTLSTFYALVPTVKEICQIWRQETT
ncbi:MAG: isochorismatase family protein [Mesorhizobium sp.]